MIPAHGQIDKFTVGWVRIMYATSPSLTSSCTPVTVTVCGVAQFPCPPPAAIALTPPPARGVGVSGGLDSGWVGVYGGTMRPTRSEPSFCVS